MKLFRGSQAVARASLIGERLPAISRCSSVCACRAAGTSTAARARSSDARVVQPAAAMNSVRPANRQASASNRTISARAAYRAIRAGCSAGSGIVISGASIFFPRVVSHPFGADIPAATPALSRLVLPCLRATHRGELRGKRVWCDCMSSKEMEHRADKLKRPFSATAPSTSCGRMTRRLAVSVWQSPLGNGSVPVLLVVL